jgi:ribonuclease BN (tRNA processing enzyme)
MAELRQRDPAALAAELLGESRRVLLVGAAGVGKSFLAGQMADACATTCTLINANIGSPVAGPPGCVFRAERHHGQWQLEELEALCTLDAGRYRLPLTVAVGRAVDRTRPGPLLIDAPGIAHQTLASELLSGLAQAAHVDTILAVTREPDHVRDLLPFRTVVVTASPAATAASKPARAAERTAQWDRYLDGAPTVVLPMPESAGPPLLTDDCRGRQIAFLDEHGHTLVLGEVEAASADELRVRAPAHDRARVRAYLVRDARRNDAGSLATATNDRPLARGRAEIELPPSATSDMVAAREESAELTTAPISAHAASARIVLVNGLFGDPTLHVRFRHHRRSLLFDIGETTRLQARIAHQISDLFVTHAHVDHIAGFLWLLRSRIGIPEPCRVFGPPGIGDRIAGMLSAIEWDRVGERAPIFEVSEVRADRIESWSLRAGDPAREARGCRDSAILLDEPGFRVRATTLDHAGIPVLAFALEESVHLNVRKERLEELAVEPGPWLETLKHLVHRGEQDRTVDLPNRTSQTVRNLAEHLLLERPGERVVYATDFGDTPANRDAVVELARGAHTLFCEAGFADKDADQATATGHLTARACAEIAAAADVGQLIPFHLSRRYEREPEHVLAEVAETFAGTFVPPALRAAVNARLG